MKVSLGPEILTKIPSFKIGLNYYTKITVSESPQMLKGRLQLFQEQLFFELDEKQPADFPGIKEWHDLSEKLGTSPNRYRPSIETLLHRIQQQNYLSPVNSAVDMNNFLSLQYEIPIGIYDTKFIEGDITFHIGKTDTTYKGFNSHLDHFTNILTVSDQESVFGSPYGDSERSIASEQTSSALQVFFLRPSMTKEEATELLQAAGKMFTTIHSGDVISNILHKDQTSIMLS